jgi:hypothetical protein
MPGGKQPGAGRPKGAPNKGRAEFLELIRSIGKPKDLVEKLKELTQGITCVRENDDGEEVIYKKPPDREAITYLLDQAYGKAKQSLEVDASVRRIEDDLDELPDPRDTTRKAGFAQG